MSVYDLDAVDVNHEAYATRGAVAAAKGVVALARAPTGRKQKGKTR